MSTNNPAGRSAPLRLEQLESREVLSPLFTGPGGGVSVAFGDAVPTIVSGNGPREYVTGTGPGVKALVRVWTQDGSLLYSFNPFGNYRGGVYVALGQLVRPDPNTNPSTPDPMELVVATAGGTTGRVKIYEFGNGTLQPIANFTPFGPNYSGGIAIATGDVAGDRSGAPTTNQSELIVGQQTGGSTVKIYTNDATAPTPQFFQIRQFQAFGVGYTGGVSLAASNIHPTQNNQPIDPYNYDYAEVIVSKLANMPEVKIFDVQKPDPPVVLSDYMALDTRFGFNRTGINVTAGSTDGIRGAFIYVNPVRSSRVTILDGWTSAIRGNFNVATPPGIVGINLAITSVDDETNFVDNGGILNLYGVYASGPTGQTPIVFPGAFNSPAGLNGSHKAP